MKTIKLLLIAIFLLGTFGCEMKQYTEGREKEERKVMQKQHFSSLVVGDTFQLTDYSLIEPRVSYMNKYTTTYVSYYSGIEYYISISNKTKIVRNVRSID